MIKCILPLIHFQIIHTTQIVSAALTITYAIEIEGFTRAKEKALPTIKNRLPCINLSIPTPAARVFLGSRTRKAASSKVLRKVAVQKSVANRVANKMRCVPGRLYAIREKIIERHITGNNCAMHFGTM